MSEAYLISRCFKHVSSATFKVLSATCSRISCASVPLLSPSGLGVLRVAATEDEADGLEAHLRIEKVHALPNALALVRLHDVRARDLPVLPLEGGVEAALEPEGAHADWGSAQGTRKTPKV